MFINHSVCLTNAPAAITGMQKPSISSRLADAIDPRVIRRFSFMATFI